MQLGYYTIPSDNRELQLSGVRLHVQADYTIPSDNRELQRRVGMGESRVDYTIPSDNRELQPSFITH